MAIGQVYITVGPKTAEQIDNWDDGRHVVDGNTDQDSQGFQSGLFVRHLDLQKEVGGKKLYGYSVDLTADGLEKFKAQIQSTYGPSKKSFLESPTQLHMANLLEALENPGRFVLRLSAGAKTTKTLAGIFGDMLTIEGTFKDSKKPLNRIRIYLDSDHITPSQSDRFKKYVEWIQDYARQKGSPTESKIFNDCGPEYFTLYLFALAHQEPTAVKDGPFVRERDRSHISRAYARFLERPRDTRGLTPQEKAGEDKEKIEAVHYLAKILQEGRNLPPEGKKILEGLLRDKAEPVSLAALETYTVFLLQQEEYQTDDIEQVVDLLVPKEAGEESLEDEPGHPSKPPVDPVAEGAARSLNELFQKNPRSLDEALLKILLDPQDTGARKVVFQAFWALEGREINQAPLTRFVPLLADEDQGIVAQTAAYLKYGFEVNNNRPDVVDRLAELLEDKQTEVRKKVFDVLSYAVQKGQKLTEAAFQKLSFIFRAYEGEEREQSLVLMEEAMFQGQELPDRMMQTILNELDISEAGSPLVPRMLNIIAIAASLDQQLPPPTLPLVRRFAGDSKKEVRESALRILHFIAVVEEKEGMSPELTETDYLFLSDSPEGRIRIAAAKGLGRLAGRGTPLSSPSLNFLEHSLKDPYRIDIQPIIDDRQKNSPAMKPEAIQAGVLDEYEPLTVTHWALSALQTVAEHGQSLPPSTLAAVKQIHEKPAVEQSAPKVKKLRKTDEYEFQRTTAAQILNTASKNQPNDLRKLGWMVR
ncbi:MAG: hypothetical protein HYU99_07435 [Deltaproteobacteria bacterium]|nr:hypothetical protein [Deltaproteobacteria bacterium]